MGDEDNFSQYGQFFRQVLDNGTRERLTDNIAGHMSNAQEFILQRAISNFAAADPNFGRMINEKIHQILQEKGSSSQTHRKRNVQPLHPPRSVPPKGIHLPMSVWIFIQAIV
eukprot:scaffold382697_cov24-Attheya_sp.AAC.1